MWRDPSPSQDSSYALIGSRLTRSTRLTAAAPKEEEEEEEEVPQSPSHAC
jgi:hypothetical protein